MNTNTKTRRLSDSFDVMPAPTNSPSLTWDSSSMRLQRVSTRLRGSLERLRALNSELQSNDSHRKQEMRPTLSTMPRALLRIPPAASLGLHPISALSLERTET